MLRCLIDAHGAAHHHDKIGLVEIDMGESGVGDVDPVDNEPSLLDGRAEAGNAFIGGVADDECGLHGSEVSAAEQDSNGKASWPAERITLSSE